MKVSKRLKNNENLRCNVNYVKYAINIVWYWFAFYSSNPLYRTLKMESLKYKYENERWANERENVRYIHSR